MQYCENTLYRLNSSRQGCPARLPPPQRNATPGPSGTRQTPTPPPSSPEPEANDQDLRARYEQFPPPAYDPADLPPPERALLPVQPRPIMGFPTLPPGRIFIRPATENDPWAPDSSSNDDAPRHHQAPPANQLPPPQQFIIINSDDEELDALEPPQSEPDVPRSVKATPTHSTLMDPILSGTNSPPSTSSSSASIEPQHGNYDDEMSRNDTSSAGRVEPPWAGTSQSSVAIPSPHWVEMRPSPQEYSITETETPTARPLDTSYREDDPQEDQALSFGWSSPYLP
ncbi:uncharacterized protein ARMOST_19242 [Armillaria ostoyae]|uniref:Uncharacterized protein n=1 Tax=Armillaria ostoyae TaxID=47428 RepID=A0A284S434_ARMOS|nr:uncharacterized protein ARMOST_19242 [Armillaria ostoyae]